MFYQGRIFLEIFSFNSTKWFILLFASRTIINWVPEATCRLFFSFLFKRSVIKIKPISIAWLLTSFCDLFNLVNNPWHHTSNESRVVVLICLPFAHHLTILFNIYSFIFTIMRPWLGKIPTSDTTSFPATILASGTAT